MKEILDALNLKVKSPAKCKPHVKVIITGDYNDADYATKETIYDLTNADDVAGLKKLLTIVRQQNEDDCTLPEGDEFDAACPGECDGCPYHNDHILFGNELMNALCDVVNLPKGPYGVCHTLTSMEIVYVDEHKHSYELADSDNPDFDWCFPHRLGISHY